MANPLKERIGRNERLMESLYLQAGPGAVEVKKMDFSEIYHTLRACDQAMDDMSKTIDDLNTSKK